MTKLFTLKVNIIKEFEVNSPKGMIKQLLFDGVAKGDYFNGIILPGGVDTQSNLEGEVGHLSARYILEGTDLEEAPCRIFVENYAEFNNTTTYPRMYTDSKALAFINGDKAQGKMRFTPDGLFIDMYLV